MDATTQPDDRHLAALERDPIERDVLLNEIREQMFGRRERARVGRFEIVRMLGRGAHGTVYLAEDSELRRNVAVKVLGPTNMESTARARLLREAQTLARLNHPNVLTIHDVGVHEGRIFIAMEYVDAGTLGRWCSEHPPGPSDRFAKVVELAIGATRGLAVAHEAGIVHRDIKPANILVGTDGRPRVADFGLARAAAEAAAESAAELTTSLEDTRLAGDGTLTRTGEIVGTPAYMSPEQFAGQGDAASDQWSLCVTFWEAAYGERPFDGTTIAALVEAVHGPPREPPDARSEVPSWWRDALLRGLRVEPSERWPSVAALLAELEHRHERPGAKAVRRRAFVIAGLGVLVAGAVGVRELLHRVDVGACDRTAAELDATWPGRKAAVRDGLLATDLPFAQGTAEQIEPSLDAWSSAWKDARREACVRANIESTVDAETDSHARACLELQRATVEGWLDSLAASDERLAADAAERFVGFRTPGSCLDPDRLARSEWPDDARLDRVLDIRRRSLGLSDAVRGGDLTAITSARALLAEAEELAFEPLIAEARLTLGDTLLEHDFTESEAMLRAAYFDAIRLDLPELAVDAALRLGSAVELKQGGAAQCLEWARHAEMSIARIGETEGVSGARLELLLSMCHRENGEYDAALAHAERALTLVEALVGSDHPLFARAQHGMGLTLAHQRRYDEALEHLHRALEIRERSHGKSHPRALDTMLAIASIHSDQGRLDEAAKLDQEVLAIREAVLGPDHLDVASALNNLANVYSAQGEIEKAIALLERCAKIRVARLGEMHEQVGLANSNLATAYLRGNRYEEALPYAEKAVQIRTAALGPEHPDVATAFYNLGVNQARLARPDEAKANLERALAIRERAFGTEHPLLVSPLTELGVLEAGRGNLDAAIAAFQRALAISRVHETGHPRKIASAAANLAEALAASGRREQAVPLYEEALAIAREHDPRAAVAIEAVLQKLHVPR